MQRKGEEISGEGESKFNFLRHGITSGWDDAREGVWERGSKFIFINFNPQRDEKSEKNFPGKTARSLAL